MKQQVQCFCIKVIPYSVKTESHIISVPAPEPFSSGINCDDYEEEEKIESQNAYKFLSTVLADFLPPNLEMEEYSVMSGDNDGYFISCSDADSDDHYYLLLRYTAI